jgi:UDPglucose 6-dehydrogenase
MSVLQNFINGIKNIMGYKLNRLKLAVVGHGFVGKAVSFGFDTKLVDQIAIDPNYGNSVEDLYGADSLDVAFVCVPTPMSNTGRIDDSIVVDVTEKLIRNTECLVVLKSTVTPEIVARLAEMSPKRFVYNPEFLTEARANKDFVEAKFNIFGGDLEACAAVASMYQNYSKMADPQNVFVSATEASFIKYTINTFLSTKVTFFNQLKDLTDKHGCNFDAIVGAVKLDDRIGNSHMSVPGPDGRRGFGGACFPKDTNAMHYFSEGQFDLLKKVLDINSAYRLQYDLDEREKEQNVKFGD